jgi:adenylosuccinate lyase
MIPRYQRPIMKTLWSDDHKFNQYLKVELASSFAWMKLGLFDEKTYQALSQATFNLQDIYDIELETKHDVIAFTRAISKSLGDEKKFFHYGLTSTDVVDTAQSLILKEVNQILLEDIDLFMDVLYQKAHAYKDLPCIGRTHGIHAEITSFGLKFALWYEDFKRIKSQFMDAAKNIEVIKMSGAVGNFSATNPEIQKIAGKVLGLSESNISTQTLQRDRHASYLFTLSLIAAELEKIAIEMRHLSRTEVMEVAEYFDANQKGSSAMPHKKNPVSSENITGLSRVVKGYALTAMDNIALWHERDISHSSAERIILSDATTLLDYMLQRYKNTLANLIVYPEHMIKNIDLTYGVIHTQTVLHDLIDQGLSRENAYDLVQKLAHQALQTKTSFKDLLKQDQTVSSFLNEQDLNQIFSFQKYLKFVDHIFMNVFG